MHDTSSYDQMKKNYFLAYHQVGAHKQFLKENPEEIVHFQQFQVLYGQQVAGGHAPRRTPGDNGFWAKKNM